jgi:hypothetical protein
MTLEVTRQLVRIVLCCNSELLLWSSPGPRHVRPSCAHQLTSLLVLDDPEADPQHKLAKGQ